MLTAPLLTMPALILAADCNRNGTEDLLDLSAPAIGFFHSRTLPVEFATWLLPFDRDGDGDPDLAAQDTGTGQIVLFENRGDADLVEIAKIDGHRESRSIAGGDLDGDGDLEFAVARTRSVRVLWNDFGSHLRETGFAVEADPHRILPADIDRDGDLDLITGNFMYDSSLDDSVSILENRGAGEFADPRTLDAHKGSPLLAAGDLDGDGDLDLVTAGYGSRQLVVLENGLTGFARRTERPDLPGFPTRYLISKDLDGDGTDEILITGYTPGLLLLSKQPGDAVPSVREKIELVPWGESHVLPLDIDGDGAVDLIAPGSGCPDLQVLLGDRSGRFAAQPPLHAGLQVSVVEAADWNGDGDLDLAGDASPSGIALLLRTPATRSTDCNRNGVPDECDRDCNQNGTPDDCDLASGASRDCDGNSIPDECDQDCDANGMADVCDIRSGKVSDCDGNGVPDSCEIVGRDRDGNGLLDDCEIASGASADCNRNGIPDPVDLRPSFSLTYEEGTVGGSPTTILLEDLDGDGVQEVMTGALSGAVSVLKCLPDGSLAGRRVGSTGAVLLDLRALDADADGDLDVAAAVYDSDCGLSRGWVAILRNDGDLRFAKGPAYPFERSLSCLAVGHFDRDGVEDIVASSTQAPFHPDGICWWLRGKAQGGFELPAQVAEWGGALAVGDVEGDGDDDLAFASGRLTLSRGDGSFVEAAPLPVRGQAIASGDLDVDGRIDFVLPGAKSQHLAMNRGDGRFEANELSIPRSFDARVLVADLQGDGRPDLIARSLFHRPALSVLFNRGGGFFGPEGTIPLGSLPLSLAAGDLDGDGDLDIAGGLPRSPSAFVLRNRGDGTFRTRATYALGSAPSQIKAIDIDGDGDLDIAGVLFEAGTIDLVLFENDGRGVYELKRRIDLDRPTTSFLAADLNEDGRSDLVMTEPIAGVETSRITIYFNRGGWNFERGPELTTGSYATGLATGDLDGDGDLEVLTLNRNSSLLVISWNDQGTFGRSSELETDRYPERILTARLDGDGLPDLIIGGQDGLRVFRNLGAGRFERGTALPVFETTQAAVAGDLDGDGDNDLVFGVIREAIPLPTGEHPRSLGVAFNAGDGTWERVEWYPAGFRKLALGLSDLDRDGDPDVIAAVELHPDDEATLVALLNAGDGRLAEAGRVTISYVFGFSSLEVADLDGDRTPDLLWTDGGSITVLLGRWRPPASLDSDRDGVPDECRPRTFRRGDADGRGGVELTDAILLLAHLFLGNRDALICPDGADADDNGALEVTDVIGILGYLFLAGDPPAAPGPLTCGPDPTADPLGSCLGASC